MLLGIVISLLGQCTSALGLNFQRYANVMESDKPLVGRWPWIVGLACMGLCELFNFVALSLVPVSIVATLGSFSIISSAVFGQILFGEVVSLQGVSGIGFIVYGAVLTVVNGPSSAKDMSVEEFEVVFKKPLTIAYFSVTFTAMVLLAVCGGGRLYPSIAFAALGAGNSINISKALAVFVKMSLTTENQLANVLPYMMTGVMVGLIVLQMKYLNLALAQSKTYIVNSIYFVMLTTMSVLNATVIYGDLVGLGGVRMMMFAAGALSIMLGVYLMAQSS